MVDVAHDGDDRRAGAQGLLVVVGVVVGEHPLELDLLLLAGVDQQHLGADLDREQLDHVVAQGLGGGDHLALLEQEADDVGGGAVQLGAELLGGGAALHHDLALGDLRVGAGVGGRGRRLQLFEAATTTATALGRAAAVLAGATTAGGTSTGTAGTCAGGTEATGTGTGCAAEAAGTGAAWTAGGTAGSTGTAGRASGPGRRRDGRRRDRWGDRRRLRDGAHPRRSGRGAGAGACGRRGRAGAGWACRWPNGAVRRGGRRGAAGWTCR